MPRLPPLPDLDWSDPSRPRERGLDDVYSADDGFAEKRVVFVQGCGLPEGWAGREHFAVGELGFGAGLAFLAAWEAWATHRPSPGARLSFLSFEGALMGAADAARIHAASPSLAAPEMQPLAGELLAKWPARARGVQRIHFSQGVSLTLFVDDVAQALPQAEARIDAWFLDGFAPSKNPAMWSPEVLGHVRRLCAPGARAATYTVAGDVRRALEAQGFSVAKVPGAGRKRERLEARLASAAEPPPPAPKRVAVIGAGVAGACAARAFLDRGCEAVLFDAAPGPASGASGNPIALMAPRLEAEDNPASRALVSAYLHARRFWLTLGEDAAQPLDAALLPRGDAERRRFARILDDPPLDEALLDPLGADPAAGLLHRSALALRPPRALAQLIEGAATRFGARIAAVLDGEDGAVVRLDSGETLGFDLAVVCAGMGLAPMQGFAAPPLTGRLGQLEHAAASGPPRAVSDGGYVVEAFDGVVFGATFEPAPEGPPPVTPEARAHNLAVLARLRPDIAVDDAALASRAAVRATTPDRLPFAGAAPANDPAGANDPGTANDKAPDGTPAPCRYVRLAGGLGSRGFLWAPLLAELLASEACGEPVPLEASSRSVLDPSRFARRALARALRRGG